MPPPNAEPKSQIPLCGSQTRPGSMRPPTQPVIHVLGSGLTARNCACGAGPPEDGAPAAERSDCCFMDCLLPVLQGYCNGNVALRSRSPRAPGARRPRGRSPREPARARRYRNWGDDVPSAAPAPRRARRTSRAPRVRRMREILRGHHRLDVRSPRPRPAHPRRRSSELGHGGVVRRRAGSRAGCPARPRPPSGADPSSARASSRCSVVRTSSSK